MRHDIDKVEKSTLSIFFFTLSKKLLFFRLALILIITIVNCVKGDGE